MRSARIILLSIIITQASTAFAYMDPGTGSMLIQAIIGGISAGIAFICLYWRKFMSLFKKKPTTVEQSKTQETPPTSKD